MKDNDRNEQGTVNDLQTNDLGTVTKRGSAEPHDKNLFKESLATSRRVEKDKQHKNP